MFYLRCESGYPRPCKPPSYRSVEKLVKFASSRLTMYKGRAVILYMKI